MRCLRSQKLSIRSDASRFEEMLFAVRQAQDGSNVWNGDSAAAVAGLVARPRW